MGEWSNEEESTPSVSDDTIYLFFNYNTLIMFET